MYVAAVALETDTHNLGTLLTQCSSVHQALSDAGGFVVNWDRALLAWRGGEECDFFLNWLSRLAGNCNCGARRHVQDVRCLSIGCMLTHLWEEEGLKTIPELPASL